MFITVVYGKTSCGKLCMHTPILILLINQAINQIICEKRFMIECNHISFSLKSFAITITTKHTILIYLHTFTNNVNIVMIYKIACMQIIAVSCVCCGVTPSNLCSHSGRTPQSFLPLVYSLALCTHMLCQSQCPLAEYSVNNTNSHILAVRREQITNQIMKLYLFPLCNKISICKSFIKAIF